MKQWNNIIYKINLEGAFLDKTILFKYLDQFYLFNRIIGFILSLKNKYNKAVKINTLESKSTTSFE